MKALCKNNYYNIISNIKMFSILLFIFGIFAVIFDNKNISLLIGFLYLSIVGFSIVTAMSLRKKDSNKWGKYLITLPVKRSLVIKSLYYSQLKIIGLGILISATVIGASIGIHGFHFDRVMDIPLLFISGASIAMFISSIYFPLSYMGKTDRREANIILSCVLGILLAMLLTTVINIVFDKVELMVKLYLGMIITIFTAISLYVLSYFISSHIYRNKEL